MLPPIEIDPKTFLRQHCTLPSLPEVLYKIQDMIGEDNVKIGTVAELMSGDPALVAQVLKVVNSAYYGLPKEVSDVRFAIAFLGLNEICRMVLSISVIRTLEIKGNEFHEFWFHSFYTAICAKYLAGKFEPLVPIEELWSAAILHDIGKLVYQKFFPDHYNMLTRLRKEQACLFNEAENHFSLPPSAFLGALLCDHWRLPDAVRRVCEFHTLSDLITAQKNGQPKPLDLMVCLGNLLATLSAEELANPKKQEIADTAMKTLNCPENDFLPLMGNIYELRREVESFMDQFR